MRGLINLIGGRCCVSAVAGPSQAGFEVRQTGWERSFSQIHSFWNMYMAATTWTICTPFTGGGSIILGKSSLRGADHAIRRSPAPFSCVVVVVDSCARSSNTGSCDEHRYGTHDDVSFFAPPVPWHLSFFRPPTEADTLHMLLDLSTTLSLCINRFYVDQSRSS